MADDPPRAGFGPPAGTDPDGYRDRVSESTTTQDEAVEICRDLLRIDTSNYGDGSGPGERAAAEHVMGLLTEVGLDPELVESEPGRATVVVRVEGDPAGTAERGALHGARPPRRRARPTPRTGRSTRSPAEERDGCLWGRGAVDMKDMDAMMLAVLRDLARSGTPAAARPGVRLLRRRGGRRRPGQPLAGRAPPRPARRGDRGGQRGRRLLGHRRRRAGDPVRLYLLQTAEKGIAWLRLVAHGRAGHGSQINDDNAVTRLAAGRRPDRRAPWPVEITPTVREFLRRRSPRRPASSFDPDDPDRAARPARHRSARFVGATLQDTANPTMLKAGYKHNVIPQSAEAFVDCRFLPGHEESVLATIRELAGPGVDVEVHHRDVVAGDDIRRPIW